MASAASISAPSYALAAGAKPSSTRPSLAKDESSISPSASVPLSTLSSSPSPTPSKELDSRSATMAQNDQKQNDVSSTATSETSATSAAATSASSTSSQTSTAAGDSILLADSVAAAAGPAAAAPAPTKPNLMPAPVPKVNVWKLRQDNLPARPVVESHENPTPAEISVATAAADKERKSSKSSVLDLDEKEWPTSLENDNNAEKKETAAKTKKTGKEKWVPYTAPIMAPSRPSRNGKTFGQRSANGTGRSASVGNVEGSGSDDHASRGKNFTRGNKPKNGSVNGSGEKKPLSAAETKDGKAVHKKAHDKKEGDKEDSLKERTARAGSKDFSAHADSTVASSDQSEQGSINASISQGKNGAANKARPQRPYNQHQLPGVNGAASRGPKATEFHNGVNGTQSTSPVAQGQTPYRTNGARSGSPSRSTHGNPQVQPQPQQHYGYQQSHPNSHHNGNSNNYNQYRRASVPAYQPAARAYYAPQQDYAAMFGFPQMFPSHPALIPGFVYEPASAVLAQVY
ncbi:hypothetical protein V1512DRAFT_134458 [Lipomyces arxii]|uniref:uncharacterized protein n=1 Tax=Lipomyces arxii TaxID=56418 RepID=UPI0034CD376D